MRFSINRYELFGVYKYESNWNTETAILRSLDEYGEELKDIRKYYDFLVSEGILNEDYVLVENDKAFEPEIGEDYWEDNHFLYADWNSEFLRHVSKLKLADSPYVQNPARFIQELIHYEFINENLLRQAFIRRSFAAEYFCPGSNEQLEFYGDTVLNTVVTRQLMEHYSVLETDNTAAPFHSAYGEGELSRIRSFYCSRDHLSARAKKLGLDKLILCGKDEEVSDAVLEDVMEALLGAVAVDTDWNWEILEEVTDQLILLQFDETESILRKSSFEELNDWHQKHFKEMPKYEVSPVFYKNDLKAYRCRLKFSVPPNMLGVAEHQQIDAEQETRSQAREYAAERAIWFIKSNGLWMRLNDAIKEPDYENSINQLQELYQKHYVEKPEYEFEEETIYKRGWECHCVCGSFEGFGRAAGKIPAKKMAAYMVLIRILESAGIQNRDWMNHLYEMYL